MKNKLKYLNKIGIRLMLVIILSGCCLDEKYITEGYTREILCNAGKRIIGTSPPIYTS